MDMGNTVVVTDISIHAPRVGSDTYGSLSIDWPTTFQSTLPVWGATRDGAGGCKGNSYFNPRSPCGERPLRMRFTASAPRFQSTLPVWGATSIEWEKTYERNISIHAPRVGSDGLACGNGYNSPGFQSTLPVWGATLKSAFNGANSADFNPRSPCGERPALFASGKRAK